MTFCKQESDSPCLHVAPPKAVSVCLCPYCTDSYPTKAELQTHLIIKHYFKADDEELTLLNKVIDRVEYLLRHSQDCRDSDVALIIEYMKRWAIKQDGRPLFQEDASKGIIRAEASKAEWVTLFSVYESIRRVREKIQNPEIRKKWEGEAYDTGLMPSEAVEMRRRSRAKKLRKVMVQQFLQPNAYPMTNADTGAAYSAPYTQTGVRL